jgi:hypothetical protein
MDRVADIIPIASRRRAQAATSPTAAPWGSVRHPRGVAGLVVAGLLFVAAVAATGIDVGANIRDLPAATRRTLYRRALDDVESACALPAAREGSLRDHCRRQARFLSLFPECDAACQRTAASILPRAHR